MQLQIFADYQLLTAYFSVNECLDGREGWTLEVKISFEAALEKR